VNKIAKYFLIFWALLAAVGLASYLSKRENRFLLVGLGVLALTIIVAVVRERLRRKKEGYYIYKRGDGRGGVLIYNEGQQSLKLYFNRLEDTIYIPSQDRWREIMPVWARERREEIVSKIKKRVGKRLIGKSWTYEETDKPQQVIMTQK
jgi:hypothetical protein